MSNNKSVPNASILKSLSPGQLDLVARLKTNPDTGLSSDQVTERRESCGKFNVVKPPVDCPPALCVILPCIKHLPSMKAFRAIQPDDAEVMRNGTWIRYDVTSLVPGDIVRLEEGDVVPADCVVLSLTSNKQDAELLVDVRAITAEEKPRSSKRVARRRKKEGSDQQEDVFVVQPVQLFWGGTVVQGGCIAVVTAIGQDCFVATLIQAGKFPPPADILRTLAGRSNVDDDDDTDEAGIALVQHAAFQEEPMMRETV